MAAESPAAEHLSWEGLNWRPGQLGLQLNKAIDDLDLKEALRLVNLQHAGGDLTSRAGLTELVTGPNAGTVHSIYRRQNPLISSFARFWGIGASLFKGETGGLAQIDTGYSGDPLTFCTYRPALTNDPWVIVADRSRLRQVQPGGVNAPLGLVKPTGLAVAVQAAVKNVICAFDASDNSQAANWVKTAGQDRSTPAVTTGVGSAADIAGKSGNAIEFTTAPGSAAAGYNNIFGLGRSLNLGWIVDGLVAATLDDIIHLYLRIDLPSKVEEVRLYLVCSDGFQPNVVPGTSTLNNTDAYVKALQPSSFTGFAELQESEQTAAQRKIATDQATYLERLAQKDALIDESTVSVFTTAAQAAADRDQSATPPLETSAVAGRSVWSEFGVIGVPLRRSDFLRIGGDTTKNWGTVSGVIVVIQTIDTTVVKVAFDDLYQTGGYGPDTAEAGAQQLDYRVSHVDRRTGVESNGSDVQASTAWVDSLRQKVVVTPVPYAGDGPANIYQRLYRRGGTNVDDWYFVDDNDTGAAGNNGAAITDTFSDAETLGTGQTVPTDHDPPITSVSAAGAAVPNQAVPIIFGPVNGVYFALGDPNRPGALYWSQPDNPNYWPVDNLREVCPPSEPLMSGCIYNEQAYVVSLLRMYAIYPDLATDGVVRDTPTAFKHGLISRWGLSAGPLGMGVVSRDGIRLTNGATEEYISEAIRPLFFGEAVEDLLPVDFTVPTAIKLEAHGYDFWFGYQDTGGTRQWLVYSCVYKYWWRPAFGQTVTAIHSEIGEGDTNLLLLGGVHSSTTRKGWTWTGYTDDGVAIPCTYKSGAISAGVPRNEKSWGDLSVEVTGPNGLVVTSVVSLNDEVVVNDPMTVALPVVADATKRRRLVFDAFGLIPQRGRNATTKLSFDAPTTSVAKLHLIDLSYQIQPEQTFQRPTAWEPVKEGEAYVTGVRLDADTFGSAVSIIVEYDLDGATYTAATIALNHDGRRKQWYSWPAVHAEMLRLRPSGACTPWLLFNAEWLFTAEPPRLALWDSGWENKWDTYYTGLDLECDTFGQDKTVEVYVDQALVGTFTVNQNGRGVAHITLTPSRGHVYRYRATDAARGLLYTHRWHLEEEPSEQANWNAPYTVEGTLSDKYIKGVLLEVDTFGLAKTVSVEIDGAVVESFSVTTTGRKVVHQAFLLEYKGRVLRLLPTDANPSRLYTKQWIFDQEPLALTRWETQETDHGFWGRQALISADVTLRSSAVVTLTITLYNQSGTLINTRVYTIPSTAGAKQKRYVPFYADAGWLFKYVFTSATPFALYREESQVLVQVLGADAAQASKCFGNDDLDPTRGMGNASAAALAPGGSA